MKTLSIQTGLFDSAVLTNCMHSSFEILKWIFCFLPFMVHGFIKSVKLFISFVNSLKPVEIFN